jgi:hypothetical protein
MLLNFTHPLTDEHVGQVTGFLGQQPEVRDIATHVDRNRSMAEVAREMVEAAQLSGVEWQTLPLVVNPPGLAPLALVLIAEIHGRCGYFPPILNIRPVEGALPPRYEVAEIVNLQALRDEARTRR